MDVDRKTLVELGVPVGAIVAFIVLVAAVGSMYGGTDLEPGGGLALVAVLAIFIIGMAVVGLLLGRVRDGDDD